MKWLVRAVCVMVALYVVLLGAVLAAMMQTPERFGQFMRHMPEPVVSVALPAPRMWTWARRGTLSEGDAAPDFTLPRQDGKGHVTLSSFRGKQPVVLVFGSYT